jgi:hypothetical protein
MKPARPCLNCGTLTTNGTRCPICTTQHNRLHPKPERPHYRGDYKRRARKVRAEAVACWLCGQGARADDPWTADHVTPGDPDSILLAAHRSCNSRRGARR